MSMRKLFNGASIDLGVCYYPEHWDASGWAQDLERMASAGLHTVRVGEFAWNLTEPADGVFDYSFFDRFLTLAFEKGMQVIFCTPTATPPAWLSTKYPQILNADMDGHLYYHGNRRHYNYNSPIYQHYAARITRKLAAHFGAHPAIVGWQLDNEFNCGLDEFYSQSDTLAFQGYLKEKFVTLDRLNRAWGTVFWNQTYTDWTEISVPRRTHANSVNPHLQLEYYRFISQSVCRFAGKQAQIIRQYCKPDDFITTNGIFANIDYLRLGRESLDFLTYDSYPNFAFSLDAYRKDDPLLDRWSSAKLTQVRALSPVFGIMEQQSGANGWNTRMETPSPRPGQMSLWTIQSIAHGADYVSFFRWRTCTFGTEMYWHGILDYSGRDNCRLREIAALAKTVESLQPVAGSRFAAQVAVLEDYDNRWDAQADCWHRRIAQASRDALIQAFQMSHTPYDEVYFDDALTPQQMLRKLSGYRAVFYPHACILTQQRVQILSRYAQDGGQLIFGCRAGYKDVFGRCVTAPLPGLVREMTGADVLEYSFIAPDEAPVTVCLDGKRFEAAVFAEALAPWTIGRRLLPDMKTASMRSCPR